MTTNREPVHTDKESDDRTEAQAAFRKWWDENGIAAQVPQGLAWRIFRAGWHGNGTRSAGGESIVNTLRVDAREVNDALDLAECCVHDQIKDPGEREWVHGILRKLREYVLTPRSASESREVYCHECSKAGGGDAPIYHSAPACGATKRSPDRKVSDG